MNPEPTQTTITVLIEALLNLISIVDTPIGRRKLGIDLDSNDISSEALRNAKNTLREFEEKNLLDPYIVKEYSRIWR